MSGDDPDFSRNKLAELALGLERALSDVDRGFVYLAEADAAFMSHAISTFLSGEHESLDRAFGLVRPRGRPKSGPEDERTMALVKAAMASDAKTWDKIAEDPSVSKLAGSNGIDSSTLRKLVTRHRPAAEREIVDEAVKRLVAGLEKRRSVVKD